MITTMLKRSLDLSRWLLLAGLLCYSSCQSVSTSFENKTDQNESRPRVFSPRMDYDEWTPLGRGDPLKNNPTFDYVPPVLDRVQYWLDSHTTEPSAKRDILVLGVTAKKTSPKIPEQFLKFVDGPKFTRNNQDTAYRNDFTGSTGAEPPKVVRTTNFRNGLVDYRNQNRIQSLPASYYPSPYYNQKTKPYTMMLPPPMVQKPELSTSFSSAPKDKVINYEPSQFSTQTEEGPLLQDSQYYALPSNSYNQHPSQPSRHPPPQNSSKSPGKVVVSQIETIKSVYTPPTLQSTKQRYETTTAPSVSFEKSNLIYQSTQTLTGGWLGNNGPTSSSTTPDVNQATWQTPDYSRDHYEIDHHGSASSNHEIVVGQNANIIVDGDSNENEEVVVGQKEVISDVPPSSTTSDLVQTITSSVSTENGGKDYGEGSRKKMHIIVANSPGLELENHKAKKGPVTVVMPANYNTEKKTNFTTPQTQETSFMFNVSEISMTDSERVPTHQVSKPQVSKSPITSSPMILEDPPSLPSLSGNRIVSHHQLLHPPTPLPSRHPGSPPHMFGPPQTNGIQPVMQARPVSHGMMHFIGSMRPGVGIHPPTSMSHLSPPMAHIHVPSVKTSMMGVGMEQLHQRPPQVQQFSSMTFTNPPISSTLTRQVTDGFEQHQSRAPETTTLMTTTSFVPTVPSVESVSMEVDNEDRVKTNQSPLVKILNEEETLKVKVTASTNAEIPSSTTTTRPSTTASPQTTTVPNLTTDPIFSHYKQPAKPIRGPMYLIIQGHSKVKTYKPTVNKHGVPVENNEIAENVTERQLSKFEQLIRENTKNGNVNVNVERKKQMEEKPRPEKHPEQNLESLMSLVENGFGSFTLSPASSATEEERQGNSVTTVEN